jgi:hypothetical protein
MQQSQHRSVQQAASHYNEVDRAKGRAARLGIEVSCPRTTGSRLRCKTGAAPRFELSAYNRPDPQRSLRLKSIGPTSREPHHVVVSIVKQSDGPPKTALLLWRRYKGGTPPQFGKVPCPDNKPCQQSTRKPLTGVKNSLTQ